MFRWLAAATFLLSPLAVAAQAAAAAPPAATPVNTDVLRVCAGSETGNYAWAAHQIAARLGHGVFSRIQILNTDGSIDNLRKLADGACDIGFTQADVEAEYFIDSPASVNTLGLLKVVYEEFVQVLCPATAQWSSIRDLGDHKAKLIVGPEDSGTAWTWRILRHADPKRYDKVERIPDPPDIASASAVMDSKNTCMLWVSGLNSGDMLAANQLSVRTPGGRPGLRLLSIDDPKMTAIKGPNGDLMYKVRRIVPRQPTEGRPGLYDHLINNGGWFSSASIDVLSVPADLVIRKDYQQAIGRTKMTRLVEAIADAQPTIWNRIVPDSARQ